MSLETVRDLLDFWTSRRLFPDHFSHEIIQRDEAGSSSGIPSDITMAVFRGPAGSLHGHGARRRLPFGLFCEVSLILLHQLSVRRPMCDDCLGSGRCVYCVGMTFACNRLQPCHP